MSRSCKDDMETKLRVGVITSPHGIGGEVRVFPTTDDVKRFKKLKEVFLDDPKGETLLHVTRARFHKNMVILKFEEYDHINQVENLRDRGLFVDREHAVKLQKDEYFIADMIGMRVISDEGEELGILRDVLQTGANDVYVVEKAGVPELLIPAIRECVLDVDMQEGRMSVRLIPGLRD